MNWWQTLIVVNIVLIGAVFLIAWFGTLVLCGSRWQRIVGFVGIVVMLNVLGFSNAALKHRPAAQGADTPISTEVLPGKWRGQMNKQGRNLSCLILDR